MSTQRNVGNLEKIPKITKLSHDVMHMLFKNLWSQKLSPSVREILCYFSVNQPNM